ncbi:MAG TPA: Rv2578c family radical SAM protein [Actinomycetota bacterium]|nr:Rv2578c family radical SAM protein [Actinomycetota bacterium]
MRWDNLRLEVQQRDDRVTVPLFDQGAVVRTFDTPEFRGMTFYEVRAKSIINRVPEASYVPFRWTINPYRGCSSACVYCFARKTHTYLDLDYGEDFNSKIVVKVNAPQLLRKELAAKKWQGEHIAMGTNVDPYQRAEGRYKLMRGILEGLRDAGNPFSILTKWTMITRDIDLLRQCAEVAEIGTNMSVGCVDEDYWHAIEPGTPSPMRRLDAVRKLNEAGIPCGVLMAPIIPFISDDDGSLERTVKAIAESGATHVSPIVLHLRKGGSREWWMKWLGENRPELVPKYRELYGDRAYLPKEFQKQVADRVHAFAHRYAVGQKTGAQARRLRETAAPQTPEPQQLSLA